MAAAVNGQVQVVVAGEVDGRHYIPHVLAAGNEGRPFVNHRIINGTRLIVIWVGRGDQVAP